MTVKCLSACLAGWLAILLAGSGIWAAAVNPAVNGQRDMIRNQDRTDGSAAKAAGSVTLFLCGDVMTGRGIDQILPYSVDPAIYESYMKSARGYVRLAERVNGPIDDPVDFHYVWGDAIAELDLRAPDVRIINLETSVTCSDDYWKGKGINYRMHPANIPILTAAGIDVCGLANNHVLDWGCAGLIETLDALQSAGIQTAGAGRSLSEARQPAVIPVPGQGRVLVFAFGSGTSGIPSTWAAGNETPGVRRLSGMGHEDLHAVRQTVTFRKRKGDIVVASIHWGGNWGYRIPREQRDFAHGLIDAAGVDIVHGHSSHHVRAIEVYRDKLILYGCGDFINDYEGIGGHEEYRGDLSLMYFARLNPASGRLLELFMTPTRMKRFQVVRASRIDTLWLKETLSREGADFGTRVSVTPDHRLRLEWD
jgi:poly-gamma-glutamate synthesis protein (capsule biosynthesis protein)